MEITRKTVEEAARVFMRAEADAEAITTTLKQFNEGMIINSCSVNSHVQLSEKAFDKAAEVVGAKVTINNNWSTPPFNGQKTFDLEVDGRTLTFCAIFSGTREDKK